MFEMEFKELEEGSVREFLQKWQEIIEAQLLVPSDIWICEIKEPRELKEMTHEFEIKFTFRGETNELSKR